MSLFKNTKDIVKIDIEFDLVDKEELVDEDDLLDLAPPVIYPTDKRPELGTCPPKGCSNCTCGRTEEKNKEVTSECGNCYLGDGYRCGSCPHKGKPPFEPGQKVIKYNDFISESYIKFRSECLANAIYDLQYNFE